MKRCALVRNGVVVNVVNVPADWIGKAGEWQPPEDCEPVLVQNVTIGDRYEGRRFKRLVTWNDLDGNSVPDFEIDPENPPEEVFPIEKPIVPPTVEEKLARVGLTIDEIKAALGS